LILGSASPRRSAILSELGIAFRVLPADVVEEQARGESWSDYLERVVREKLAAVADRVGGAGDFSGILVADTIVLVDQDVLGKPSDPDEAVALLSRLVGRSHRVFTRYAISRAAAPAEIALARSVESIVTMRTASAEEIRAYASTGEGLDKAGAYAAQGIGQFLIERIEGSYSNVVGLPACEVVRDLCRVGLLERYP